MTDLPETRFARNGNVHLAYQVFGSGPIDILFVDDWVHHVELVWEIPEFALDANFDPTRVAQDDA